VLASASGCHRCRQAATDGGQRSWYRSGAPFPEVTLAAVGDIRRVGTSDQGRKEEPKIVLSER